MIEMNNTNEKNKIKPSVWFWNSMLVAAWLLTGFIKIEFIFLIWFVSFLPAIFVFLEGKENNLWFWLTPTGLLVTIIYCCITLIIGVSDFLNKLAIKRFNDWLNNKFKKKI